MPHHLGKGQSQARRANPIRTRGRGRRSGCGGSYGDGPRVWHKGGCRSARVGKRSIAGDERACGAIGCNQADIVGVVADSSCTRRSHGSSSPNAMHRGRIRHCGILPSVGPAMYRRDSVGSQATRPLPSPHSCVQRSLPAVGRDG